MLEINSSDSSLLDSTVLIILFQGLLIVCLIVVIVTVVCRRFKRTRNTTGFVQLITTTAQFLSFTAEASTLYPLVNDIY